MNTEESDQNAQPFLCPECGGEQADRFMMVETEFNATDPWSAVLQRSHCAQCGSWLPNHLAERWHGLSIEAARAEWQKVYRRKAERSRRHRGE